MERIFLFPYMKVTRGLILNALKDLYYGLRIRAGAKLRRGAEHTEQLSQRNGIRNKVKCAISNIRGRGRSSTCGPVVGDLQGKLV